MAKELKPVEKKGVKERIAQIIDSNTEPKLEDYEIIIVIDDDTDESRAYVVVRVKKAQKPPTWTLKKHKYYIRRGNRSVLTLDNEVKSLLFRRGILQSLLIEIKSNLELINKTWNFIDNLTQINEERRKPSLFIPLKNEAWRAFQYSGYSYITLPEILNKLVDAYNLIHEINNIIDLNNHIAFKDASSQVVATPIHSKDPEAEIYIPALIRNKLQERNI